MFEERANVMPNSARAKRNVLGIGLAQGIALLILHQMIENNSELARSSWVVMLYTVSVFTPASLMYLLASGLPLQKKTLLGVLAQSVVLALTAFYASWMSHAPTSLGELAYHTNFSEFMFCYVISAMLFWLLTLTLITAQQQVQYDGSSYAHHYACGLDITMVFILASIVLGILWILLALWAGLFAFLGIDFFAEIFVEQTFIYPASCLGLSYSLYTVRSRYLMGQHAVRRMFSAASWLLPLAAFIVAAFLITLCFSGFQKLWDSDFATTLTLSLQLLVLVLINAAYQDGENDSPYPARLRQFVNACVLLLPAYSLLAAYALYLRVDQYGWTIERYLAAWIILFTAFLSFGYAYAASARGGRWMERIERINLLSAMVVIGITVLIHTPLLHPAIVSVSSQVARLKDGTIKAEKFDYQYLRFKLGRAGVQALHDLKADEDVPEKETVHKLADQALTALYYSQNAWQNVKPMLEAFPEGTEIPADLNKVLMSLPDYKINICKQDGGCGVLKIDLNEDGREEYILLTYTPEVFSREGEKWESVATLDRYNYSSGPKSYISELKENNFSLRDPEWKVLKIGENVFRARPREEKKDKSNDKGAKKK